MWLLMLLLLWVKTMRCSSLRSCWSLVGSASIGALCGTKKGHGSVSIALELFMISTSRKLPVHLFRMNQQ